MLIVCEGIKTEPAYFNQLKREEEVRLVQMIVEDSGGVPKTLVDRAVAMLREAEREAKRFRDENLRYEEVWCVFDVDEHPKLAEAQQQARDNGIRLAISNPCFELWILLHFRDQTAYIHRHHAQHACGEFLHDYAKTVAYSDLSDGYSDAVRRATALEQQNETLGEAGRNPSTSVFHLTERLRELGRDAQLRRLPKR